MYKQSKLYLILRFLVFFIGYCVLIWFVIYASGFHGRYIYRFIGGSMSIFFFGVLMDYQKRCQKYISFFDKHMRINAYHKNHAILKTKDLDIMYEDITSIRLRKIPVIGIIGIEIDANNHGNGILIHRFYKDFSDICRILYKQTIAFSQNVRVDSDVLDYLQRKEQL